MRKCEDEDNSFSSLRKNSYHAKFQLYIAFASNCFYLTKTLHLTPLFNWNVKQLFLYLTAEYETENNEFNQVRFSKLVHSFTLRMPLDLPYEVTNDRVSVGR